MTYKLQDDKLDVFLANEACVFVLTSERFLSAVAAGELAIDWEVDVQAGRFAPVELVEDRPFTVRVRLDELSEEEQSQWVGRFSTRLSLPDGRLALCPGNDCFENGLLADMPVVEVPAGDYRLTFFIFANSPNGEEYLESAGCEQPLGTYMRQTRPGEDFPVWLKALCVDLEDTDPGHEEEWARFAESFEESEVPENVDFLVQLVPLERCEAPEIPERVGGNFSFCGEARIPERFPLGVMLEDLVGTEPYEWDESSNESGPPVEPNPPNALLELMRSFAAAHAVADPDCVHQGVVTSFHRAKGASADTSSCKSSST